MSRPISTHVIVPNSSYHGVTHVTLGGSGAGFSTMKVTDFVLWNFTLVEEEVKKVFLTSEYSSCAM